MDAEPSTQRVAVTFVGGPPCAGSNRRPGVSEVEIEGPVVRCLVAGRFQPFLEALRGSEVLSLQSTPVAEPVSAPRVEGEL